MVGHFSLLNAISIFLSISVIASKSWVVAWSPHTPTMVFNALCIVADVVGFFAALAWMFEPAPIPELELLHTSLRGWFVGLVAMALMSGTACSACVALGVALDEILYERLASTA